MDSSLPGGIMIVMPILIFFARVIDVSIGTMRVIFVSRGYKLFASFCGFFEVLIWLVAITQIMQNLTNAYNYVAYAAGFATGNFVGMLIEEKIAIGRVMIRIVTPNDISKLREYLKNSSYGVTLVTGTGLYGPVNILFTVIPRLEVDHVVRRIKQFNPKAFYTIEDIRFVQEDHIIYGNRSRRKKLLRRMANPLRKGK